MKTPTHKMHLGLVLLIVVACATTGCYQKSPAQQWPGTTKKNPADKDKPNPTDPGGLAAANGNTNGNSGGAGLDTRPAPDTAVAHTGEPATHTNMTHAFPNNTSAFPNTTGAFAFNDRAFPNSTGAFPNTTGAFPNTTGAFPFGRGLPPNTTGAFPNRPVTPPAIPPTQLEELPPLDLEFEEEVEVVEEEDTEPVSVAPVYPPGMKIVTVPIELPAPAFRGTPVPLNEPNVEKPRGKPRDPFQAPEGTVNLALGKTVSSSDPAPAAGELDLVTDGDKEATDFGCLELNPGAEWIQVDLEERATVWAVLVWHNHAQGRVYRDVVVQVSDDPDFLESRTVFNNDYDNSSGMGTTNVRGKLDMGYVETSEGKLVQSGGLVGRYVRLHSRGNTTDDKNHYTEVEVYGIPKD